MSRSTIKASVCLKINKFCRRTCNLDLVAVINYYESCGHLGFAGNTADENYSE
jgi:hypothetical protein